MQNEAIAQQFAQLAFLLELQGENPFKVRAFQKVADLVADLPAPVELMENVEGIGKGSRALIEEWLRTGEMEELEKAKAAFPPGILELREVRGLGAKKIKALWEQLQISSLSELEYACTENRLVDLKGFGEKTQQNILKSIHHLKNIRGRALLSRALEDAQSLIAEFPGLLLVGDLAQHMETVDRIEFLSEKKAPLPERSECGLPILLHRPKAGERLEDARVRLGVAPTGEGLLTEEQLRGVFHLHTTASDGKNTLEEMVAACVERGWEYVGVSDHSQSAFYAGGLKAPDIKRQRAEIDALREKFPGITIFHGIESDILPDGSLDYPEEVLRGFDFVIASIHGQMKMDRAAMTARVCRALENPHTTWLGHLTGRLLLGRPGYELDVEKVFRTTQKCGKGIELNSNPYRLDVDWRLLPELRSLGVPVGVFPDAHSVEGLSDVKWGVLMARKGGLGPEHVSNTKSAREMQAWLNG